MTNYTNKIVTAIATVALLANGLTPIAFAGTTITVIGNGADSNNTAIVNNTQSTSVSQNNNANFDNNVSGSANTGDNDANKNTGGSVSVSTGNATVNNTVSNAANQNYANVSCGCDQGDTLVKIGGNGAKSDNDVNLNTTTAVGVSQNNYAHFDNDVWGDAKTGNNDANENTGGNVEVNTGDASVKNNVSNWANSNSAKVGGSGGPGSMSLMIVGNGADSDNTIIVKDTNSVSVAQNNNANFDNNVGGSANTGDNDANQNTGGNVEVNTGDASVKNNVDNMANFNWADLNCGCTFGDGGLEVNVDSNGADTDNDVNAYFTSAQGASQGNYADFKNHLGKLNAETGNNDANENGGGAHGDPSVITGDASIGADVSNTANLNGLGGSQPEWPSWDMGGVHVNVNIDIQALLAALGL